ncbi:uncharacterized protein P884DRAFT_272329 [Thermothelomyces heterothallicus CBS 202.75]|uniref:uncharacterized protein n=1 Tax=Thermothelomyces heterothallicus CBS 202.75 TaxID=1149848 RepID=UPI003742F3E7
MASPSVIVFGPTGGVGSVVARTAHAAGARVTLAMRDPSKPTAADLPATLPRVRADLSDPASVREAAAQAGARAAFLYLVIGLPDRMRATVEALRDAGVEYVVFLSSAGLRPGVDVRAVTPDEFLAWQHAGVEAALHDVFGAAGYVAVRPGFFASNLLQYKAALAAAVSGDGDGVVRVPAAEARLDFILPEDIGRVAGRLLVTRDARGPVTLLGPEPHTFREALELVGRALGKPVVVEEFASADEAARYLTQTLGYPDPVARYLVGILKRRAQDPSPEEIKEHGEAAGNILKYGGKEPGRLVDWVEANRAKFLE